MNEQDFLVKWAEYNRIKWGCQPLLSRFKAVDSEAYCESLLFLDGAGKIYLPPLNPYHLTMFCPTPTNKQFRINNQWHKVAEELANELLRLGGSASFILPPTITDIRPFLWRDFSVDVKYTYHVRLPYSVVDLDVKLRSKINRANSLGYQSVMTSNMKDVYECLIATETRKGFVHQLNLSDLELARRLLGDKIFRCFVCYTSDGEPVCASISLIINDHYAIGWIAGSKTKHLRHGVVQQLQNYEFSELASLGISQFDLCGANIPSVAESKSYWGGELIPYYGVRVPGYKEVLRAGKQWLMFNKKIVST